MSRLYRDEAALKLYNFKLETLAKNGPLAQLNIMTEGTASKLLNGDTCHRTANGKKSVRNGFVKNHCLFQQQQQLQKYRRPKEKVRPCSYNRSVGRIPGNTIVTRLMAFQY